MGPTNTAKSRHDTPRRTNAVKVATWDALVNKPPEELEHFVCTKPALIDAVDKAKERLVMAQGQESLYATQANPALRERLHRAAVEAKAAVEKAETAVEEATVLMRFRAIDSLAYDDLMERHPPTDAQQEKSPVPLAFDGERFPIALIAATLIEPELSIDQLNELRAKWNNAEFTGLQRAAQAVCNRLRVADVGKD